LKMKHSASKKNANKSRAELNHNYKIFDSTCWH
jgi:hypothetical protein